MARNKLYGLILFLSVIGYVWLFWNYSNAVNVGTPLCFFRKITGLPCPSCGITHSIVALMHGNLLDAIKANPLGLLMIILLIIFPFWIIVDLLLNENSFFRFYNWIEVLFKMKWIAIPSIALIIILWIINIRKSI
jgi:hypothetical protein